MNLGRIYAQKGMVRRAIQEFEAALEMVLSGEIVDSMTIVAVLRAARTREAGR